MSEPRYVFRENAFEDLVRCIAAAKGVPVSEQDRQCIVAIQKFRAGMKEADSAIDPSDPHWGVTRDAARTAAFHDLWRFVDDLQTALDSQKGCDL